MRINPPPPFAHELPTHYAKRVADWYMSWQKPKKELCQYFTPSLVAKLMVQHVPVHQNQITVLDAGAGMGILSCAICEVLEADVYLVAYELDSDIVTCLSVILGYAQQWMSHQGRVLTYRIYCQDFVLDNAPTLMGNQPESDLFDVIISNPPYLKIAKSDPRAIAMAEVVYGQPNLYMLFMAVAVALLRPSGWLVFITPRSYTSGAYFQRFREFFFRYMNLTHIHLFESRTDVFEDVLQESIILWAERRTQQPNVTISTSHSINDLENLSLNSFDYDDLVDNNGVLHLPTSLDDFRIIKLFQTWSDRLENHGFSISTGKVIPFRCEDSLRVSGNIEVSHAPLFWLQNITAMKWEWPKKNKPQYVAHRGAEHVLIPNQNCILIRRFSPKEGRRLIATPFLAIDLKTPFLGIENHLNYIYCRSRTMTTEETYGLAVFLNSSWVDTYFQLMCGNTQVGATDIRNLPLPSLQQLIELGKRYLSGQTDIDVVVQTVLRVYA